MSYYKDVFFVICLFIFLSSANSLLRQVTDDFITKLRPSEEVGQVQDVDNNGLNLMSIEFSSSSTVLKGLRDDPPSSYSLKMKSFTTLLKSKNVETYESRPFMVGGYNWTLTVYPKGNKHENGTGFISMYVTINKSHLITPDHEVHTELRFYIYNNIHNKYFTIKDSNVRRFSASNTMLGFSQVMAIDTFTDLNNGYLFDDDHCEFGVDVIITHHFQKSELFNVTHNFEPPSFTWSIRFFSAYLNSLHEFTIGDIRWSLYVGRHGEQGEYLSVHLGLSQREQLKLKPYQKIYTRAKLRVLNQLPSNNVEKTIDEWFNIEKPMWGYDEFMSYSDALSPDKGYLVNEFLRVQVEIEAASKTTYFPDEP